MILHFRGRYRARYNDEDLHSRKKYSRLNSVLVWGLYRFRHDARVEYLAVAVKSQCLL
jgi:hypothetical protein